MSADALLVPPGAQRLLAMREVGRKPDAPVIVTFTGQHSGLGNLHLYPRPGVVYDWSCVDDLAVQIRVRPGVNAALAMAAIFKLWDARNDPSLSYPVVVDEDLKQVSFLVGPPSITWPVREGTSLWREFFGN